MVEVFKFGGTCTASPSKLDRITEIIKTTEKPLVVTLSAAAGVTNQIKQLLDSKIDDDIIITQLQLLKDRHINLLDNRFDIPSEIDTYLQRLERLLYGILYTEELTDRTFDLVMTFGERLIVPILKEYLDAAGISTTIANPEEFIITNGTHKAAMVDLGQSESLIQSQLKPKVAAVDVVLVPGFYGVSEDHVVTTLGRSGTDYTASVLAYGLQASSITIWKDVFGFMSADPTLVEHAHTIPYLSYQEAAELAYFGAKLLHPRAASPARLRHIPIYIRHIDHLESITCINSDRSHDDSIIKSVSHMTELAVLKVYAAVGGNTKGVLARIAEKIRQAGGNTISVATSQTCIAFLMNEYEAQRSVEFIQSLGPDIVDSIEIQDDISLICVVGEGLGSKAGVASRVFDAVSSANINVELISAGASSTAYHFTVAEKDLKPALLAIHTEFFEE